MDQLVGAFKSGGLEIEERRRRKAEETIQQVKEGALEKLRGDYLTIQANVQETMRQLKATGLLERKRDVDQALATMQNDKEELTNKLTEVRRRTDAVTRTIDKDKASIQQQIAQLTGKHVEIQAQ